MLTYPLDRFWNIDAHYLETMAKVPSAEIVGNVPEIDERVGDDSDLIKIVGDVAIIPIRGVMMKDPNMFMRFFGGTSTRVVQRLVEVAASDPEIATIILLIDSPGGSVNGLAELADAVFKARESKQVIAQVDGMMASAALLVGSQAHKVHAGRLDLVGSIGTVSVLHDTSALFENEGIKTIPVTTGQFKAIGEPGTEVTDEQVAEVQKIVDLFFDDFKVMVARGRKMSMARVNAIADGRVFGGEEAMELGLVDKIQTLDVTMARLEGTRKRLATRSRRRTAATAFRMDEMKRALG